MRYMVLVGLLVLATWAAVPAQAVSMAGGAAWFPGVDSVPVMADVSQSFGSYKAINFAADGLILSTGKAAGGLSAKWEPGKIAVGVCYAFNAYATDWTRDAWKNLGVTASANLISTPTQALRAGLVKPQTWGMSYSVRW